MKKALITGITGQDGSYLLNYLEKGYGRIIRRASTFSTDVSIICMKIPTLMVKYFYIMVI